MDIKSLFQDFNPGKFLVYLCLSIFTYTFALRLDDIISLNYWIVFMPLWIWKLFAIFGAIIGTMVWIKRPRYRLDHESYVQYKTMLISFGLHLLLLMFELLLCDKLETGEHLWILVFVPLIFASAISIPICVWSFHHRKSFELELFCGINSLQFIFLSLKLDNFVTWSWMTIFIPSWVTVCLAILAMVSAMFLAITLIRSPNLIPEQRRHNLYAAVTYSFLIIPILIFQVLLISKLNDGSSIKYTQVVLPLMLSLLTLLALSFSSKPQNPWWFGLRKDFCSFFLANFPSLQEYGNISYHCFRGSEDDKSERSATTTQPAASSSGPGLRPSRPPTLTFQGTTRGANPHRGTYSQISTQPSLNGPPLLVGTHGSCPYHHSYCNAFHPRATSESKINEGGAASQGHRHGANSSEIENMAARKSQRKKVLDKLYMLPTLLSAPIPTAPPTATNFKGGNKSGMLKKEEMVINNEEGCEFASKGWGDLYPPFTHLCIYAPD